MSPPVEARGSLHRGFVGDRTARFLLVSLPQLAELTRQRHGLGPDAARVCAEAMVASALMSAWIKGSERITLQLQAERPAFAFVCDVDAEGGLRARLAPGLFRHPVGRGVDGLMLAIKADVQREVYRGVTALDGRTIEAALRGHLSDSTQVDVILRIGVEQDPDGKITGAGGVVVERLPQDLHLPSITPAAFVQTYQHLEHEDVFDTLVAAAFGKIAGHEVEVLEERALRWRCSCSQERIEAVLFNLGPAELQAMWQEDNGAEISCHFCNIHYQVSGDRLAELCAMHARGEA